MTDPIAAEPAPTAPSAADSGSTPEAGDAAEAQGEVCEAVRLVKLSRGARIVIDGAMRVAEAEAARLKLMALVGGDDSHRIKSVVLEPQPANIPALQLSLAAKRALGIGPDDGAAKGRSKSGKGSPAKRRKTGGETLGQKG